MAQVTQRVDMATVWGRIGATPEQITAFCERWNIRWLALFGSVLRDDFDPSSSDIDALYEPYVPNQKTVPNSFAVQDALAQVFGGRDADFISVHTLKWRIRSRVFAQAVTLFGEPPPEVIAAQFAYDLIGDEMPKDEQLYIGDMLDNAREVRELAVGKSYADLFSDRMFYLSVVHLIQMVGEAARNVSPQTRSQHLSRSAARFGRNRRAFACGFLPMRRAFTCRYPVQNQLRTYLGIPWQSIVRMRNNLVHGYDRINNEKVWETVTNDIPALIAELEAMLPPKLREEPPPWLR